MGSLPPRYSFLLNSYANERFARCPRCEAKTRVRRVPLVVHLDSFGLVLVRKTCRLCVVCEMLIADEVELNRVLDSLRNDGTAARSYLVLGTLETKTWREGMSGAVTIQQVKQHMADFKAYMGVDITPRHRARKD